MHRSSQPRRRRIDRAALFTTGLFLGIAVGMPAGGWISEAHADPATPSPTPSIERIISFATGQPIPEDSPAFDCRIDGNRICGVGNSQGVPAGVYRDSTATSLADLMLGR